MVPTIDPKNRLDVPHEAILFTLIRLKLDPRLQAFVPVFEQLLEEWWDTLKLEHSLLGERLAADVAADTAGEALSGTSDGVAATLLVALKNNRRSPVFTRYFGSKRPSRFKKPRLGKKLQAMRTWPPSLIASANPTLKAYGEALVLQIEVADNAITRVSSAEQKVTDFQTIGERKQFFDKVNGARKHLHGAASKLAHDHPEWNLSPRYADSLFQHESSEPEPSISDLERKIAATTADLAKLTAQLDTRIKAEEAEAKEREEAEKKAKQKKLAAAAKAAAEANAWLEQLQAELGPADV